MDTLAKSSRRPARFASVVVEDLAREIISGKWAEGDLVPTEPALCEEFGFSRTVIREALKLLEERGLVRVEQGRGTSVSRAARGTCSTRSCSASRSSTTTTSRCSTT